MTEPEQQAVLRRYAAGELGTRETIERAGLDGFADLLIGLARYDLALPGPADTPERRANVERARAVLQPLLRANAG
jgi:hypothetical protein